MKRYFLDGRKPVGLTIVLLAAVLAAGCGRQPNAQGSDQSSTAQAAGDQKLPFENESEKTGISPTGSLVPMPSSLPAGTPITIRLQSGVSTQRRIRAILSTRFWMSL